MPPKGSARGRTQQRDADKEPETPFHPAADAATFRDLLIFEERLKQNAARLQARKRKYEMLLFGFVSFILCLSHLVVISPRSSVFLQYSLAAVLMICLTTLFLFFASGMHAERIRSANKFVPQANRSLRNFNMYLNTRANRTAALSSGTSTSSIPPAQNTRGELIFSSRVSPEFREGYEKYRAAFERRRAEKIAAKRAQSWKRWFDFALGKSSDAATKSGSSVARHTVDSRPRKAARTSKSRNARSTRASIRTEEVSAAATPAHAGLQLEDLSDAPSDGLSEVLSDGLSDGGLSEEGGSMSGHEPS
ncbi:F-box domain-containing protein [Pseudozyma hubeiensis]|nr:F-box domain-containing protein [Pseudozyma hubeiensis]